MGRGPSIACDDAHRLHYTEGRAAADRSGGALAEGHDSVGERRAAVSGSGGAGWCRNKSVLELRCSAADSEYRNGIARRGGRGLRSCIEEEVYYDKEKDQLKVIGKEVKWLATTLSKDEASSLLVYRMERSRWWVENNGNRDLKTNWHMDHNFVHSPTALKAIRLILFMAFNLFYLFLHLQHRGFRAGALWALQAAMEFFKSYCCLKQKVWARKKRKRICDDAAMGGIDSS